MPRATRLAGPIDELWILRWFWPNRTYQCPVWTVYLWKLEFYILPKYSRTEGQPLSLDCTKSIQYAWIISQSCVLKLKAQQFQALLLEGKILREKLSGYGWRNCKTFKTTANFISKFTHQSGKWKRHKLKTQGYVNLGKLQISKL